MVFLKTGPEGSGPAMLLVGASCMPAAAVVVGDDPEREAPYDT